MYCTDQRRVCVKQQRHSHPLQTHHTRDLFIAVSLFITAAAADLLTPATACVIAAAASCKTASSTAALRRLIAVSRYTIWYPRRAAGGHVVKCLCLLSSHLYILAAT